MEGERLKNRYDENGAFHGTHEGYHGKTLWYLISYSHGEKHGCVRGTIATENYSIEGAFTTT